MKRSLHIGLIVTGLAVVFTLFSASSAKGQKSIPRVQKLASGSKKAAVIPPKRGILGQILDRMEAHRQGLTLLRADVTMVKFDSVLKVNDTSVGTTIYAPKAKKRDMAARVDWTRPVQEQMAVIGDKYEIYQPKMNQVITGNVKKASGKAGVGGAFGFMSMSKEQLRLNYKTIYLGEETIMGGTPTWHLELQPLRPQDHKSAELWVDTDGMPRQAKIIHLNNDSTTVLLSNPKKNETYRKEAFQLKYPKSVKKVRG